MPCDCEACSNDAEPTAAGPTAAGLLGPADLGDPSKYTCVPNVPVLLCHDDDRGPGGAVTRKAVDVGRLSLLESNNNALAAKGQYAIVTLGHSHDGNTENDQGKPIGAVTRFQVGQYLGEPALLATLCVQREHADEASTYPHRSAEVWSGSRPSDHVISSVALLRRAPRFNLGLLTRYSRPGQPSRYTMTAGRRRPSPTPRRRSPPMSRQGTPDRYARSAAEQFRTTSLASVEAGESQDRTVDRLSAEIGRQVARYAAATGKSYAESEAAVMRALEDGVADDWPGYGRDLTPEQGRKVARYAAANPGVGYHDACAAVLGPTRYARSGAGAAPLFSSSPAERIEALMDVLQELEGSDWSSLEGLTIAQAVAVAEHAHRTGTPFRQAIRAVVGR